MVILPPHKWIKIHFFLHYFDFILALKKMVVNHIDKTFVTSDAATILK